MNPFLAPLQLFVRSLNLLPGVSASVRTEHVEVTDRFDCAPDGETATVVVDDSDATVDLGRHAVTVHAEGVERSFDLPFDPVDIDRHVSNGMLTVDIA